ncbi:MAG: GNAT family N-acetyltransferase [Frankiales bacterium]|nr:GNAT family N-acetyltransferase [Frankiales bacterium]
MRDDDVDAAQQVQEVAFRELDQRLGEPVTPVSPESVERQRRRHRHFIAHDPAGSWVATSGDEIVGSALALRRDSMWGLSLLVVHPDHQSRGIGRQLLDASLSYADGVGTAIILSSSDARAMRRYARAGFALFPQMMATGAVDRTTLPAADRRVRVGSVADAELADSVDRQVRGAARGPDHGILNDFTTMYVAEDAADRGYAYIRNGHVVSVAATDEELATRLLWQCLADEGQGSVEQHTISHVTGEQQWAIDVAVAARLSLKPWGPVFWRGRTPPRCYLPDGAYL